MALVTAAYVPALGGDFIWDDDDYVSENPMLRSPRGLWRIWTDLAATPQYYPLTHTTFWIEFRLWGARPFGFHVVNVLLHAGTALVLWSVLRRLRVPGAWLGAALFALHPVQVESVAWITERKNVLSGLFYMAAMLAYLRFEGLDGESSRGQGSRGAYVTALALFTCALLSKTVTATLPFTLALVLWWQRGRLRRVDLVRLAPMVALGAVLGGVTAALERFQIGATGAEWSLSWLERLLLAPRIVWFYLWKLVWPLDLTFIYPRWTIRAGDPAAWLFPVALAGLFAALWAMRQRTGRGPITALSHFVIALGPALGFINVYPMRYSFVADHFQYLASIGPLTLAGAGIWIALDRGRLAPVLRYGAAAVLVSGLAALSASQARVYTNLETLWRDTLAKNSGAWAAHNNLGAMLGERGALDEAAEHLARAVELKEDHAGAYANLGLVRARQGRIDDAITALQHAARLSPDDASTRVLLGQALFQAGRTEDAESHLVAAVRLAPGDPQARHLLGNALVSRSRYDLAVPHFRAALERVPGDFSTRLNLGSALAKLGQYPEALEHLGAAHELDPGNTAALYSLGTLLLNMGRPLEAAERFEQALRLDPGFEAARRQLERARGTAPFAEKMTSPSPG